METRITEKEKQVLNVLVSISQTSNKILYIINDRIFTICNNQLLEITSFVKTFVDDTEIKNTIYVLNILYKNIFNTKEILFHKSSVI